VMNGSVAKKRFVKRCRLRKKNQAEDLFDVHSEDKESAAEWARLKAEAAKQKSKLITFIKENPEILPQVLSLTR
jgi:hypothetical protein